MFCPKINGECRREACAWWSEAYENTCVVVGIELLLSDLKEYLTREQIQQ